MLSSSFNAISKQAIMITVPQAMNKNLNGFSVMNTFGNHLGSKKKKHYNFLAQLEASGA